jgi:hypothetical protein
MMAQEFYFPGQPKPDLISRKARFAALNVFVAERHGWLTSVPGAEDVSMECLPDSTLPDDLRDLGYVVLPDGVGQRILHNAIIQKFTSRADGGLDPLAIGSTLPGAQLVQHAGIVTVTRWIFELP